MRKTRHTQLRGGVLILAIALFGIGMLPMHVHAAVDCNLPQSTLSQTDSDRDGLSDAEECAGLSSLFGEQTLKYSDGSTATEIQSCAGGAHTEKCLDPNTQDLFIMLILKDPSAIPAACLNFTPLGGARSTSKYTGGLAVTTHNIIPPSFRDLRLVERQVTNTQYSIQFLEDADTTSGADWGQTVWGGPNNGGVDNTTGGAPLIISFPKRIETTLESKGVPSREWDRVKCRSVAHEVGHSIAEHYLFDLRDKEHTPVNTGSLMDVTVYINTKRTPATVTSPTGSSSTQFDKKCLTKIIPQLDTGICTPYVSPPIP